MVRPRFRSIVLSLPLLLTVGATAGSATAGSAGSNCVSAWGVVSSPNVTPRANSLNAVGASSATDAWAVGWYANAGGVERSLAQHWDGATWTVVPTPTVGVAADVLEGVTSGPAQGTWAVGITRDDWLNSGVINPLILHWDGTAWQVSTPAVLPVAQNTLGGVAGLGANDVWAVGDANTGSPGAAHRPLVEHWNGTVWTVVPTPSLTESAGLSGVTEISPTDVWAVGWRQKGNHIATLAEHWDGSSWTMVSTPFRPGQDTSMRAISAASSTEVWMAGSTSPVAHVGWYRPFTERWDGSSWTTVTPPPMPRRSFLLGVAALAPGQAVAVGAGTTVPYGPDLTLIERWDGTAWSIESSPSPSSTYNVLYGVASAGGVTWAAGGYEDGNGKLRTLIEESC